MDICRQHNSALNFKQELWNSCFCALASSAPSHSRCLCGSPPPPSHPTSPLRLALSFVFPYYSLFFVALVAGGYLCAAAQKGVEAERGRACVYAMCRPLSQEPSSQLFFKFHPPFPPAVASVAASRERGWHKEEVVDAKKREEHSQLLRTSRLSPSPPTPSTLPMFASTFLLLRRPLPQRRACVCVCSCARLFFVCVFV